MKAVPGPDGSRRPKKGRHPPDVDFSSDDLLKALPDAVVLVDTLGVIRHVTEAMQHLSGFSPEELLGQPVEVLIPATHRANHARRRRRFSRNPMPRPMGGALATTLIRKDGSEVAVDIGLGSMRAADELWILAAIRDCSIQRAAERAYIDAEQRFRLAFEDNMAPMTFSDLEDRCIAVNDSFCKMVGFTREELLGHDSVQFTYPEDVGVTEGTHLRLTSGETDQVRYTKRYLRKDGRIVYSEVSRSAARGADGTILYFVASERDVTDRRRRDRILELRAKVDRLAIRAADEAVFLQQLCELLVEHGGYRVACIEVPSSGEEGGVEIAYAAGATDYLYAGGRDAWWGSKESGLGPTGTALRTGVTQVIDEVTMGGNYETWRERTSGFGIASFATIPYITEVDRATVSLYSQHPFAFDELTVKGLEEITREAEFAINHVRVTQRTREALEATTVAISALRESERARADSEQHFQLAFENNMAPIIFTDLENRLIAANDAFCQMIGYTRDELTGHGSSAFTHAEDLGISEEYHRRLVSGEIEQARYVKRYIHKDGRTIAVEISKAPAIDPTGKTLYFVASQRDITDERELTAQLSHQALHDPLTGLANRALFEDRLSQAYARIVRQGGLGAVLLVDLDDFKGVNDTYGHLVGDQLLVGIARRFELVTRSTDTLCRLGGDEFLYLAEGLTSVAEAEEVANRLLDVLTEPFSFNGIDLQQHASIGVVVCDGTSMDRNDCVQEVDVALYEAKRNRRGRHVFFNPSMRQEVVSRFALVQELHHALPAGELSMHYQPILDLATTEVVGFEALMRWQHPEEGWIPPNVFIPLAEQSELILELGVFALNEAVEAASSWVPTRNQVRRPYVTVNLSAHQFRDPDLTSIIEGALSASGLSPDRLIIEITESVALLDATETMNTLSNLRRIGIGIALDDFGTGYSSLSYIALLLPKVIKIDRSFISPRQESAHDSTLLEAIISLGRNLNATVLAEGIETQQQFRHLRELGCQLGQGYLFSPAVPASDVPIMLDKAPGDWGQEGLHFQPRLDLPTQ